MAERPYDIVVLGATGFTGALTAEYLARHAPAETRWALAGRNMEKLEQVRTRLGSGFAEVPLLRADVTDAGSLRDVAEATRVVITTVGPYIRYGEPLVAACAAAGTDYVDLTGESEFVDRMWLGYHEQAVASGARIVHSCGFDSIPYDLGALFTVEQLPEEVPISLEGFIRGNISPSGGTYQTTIEIFSRLRQGAATARERRGREPRPSERRVRGITGMPRHDEFAGGWVLPLPTIDPQTILRSARALERYGPDFTYSHYLVAKRLPALVGLTGGAAGLIALAQIPPTRKALLKLKSAGEGPSAAQRAKAWFRLRFRGEGGGRRVLTQVSGSDPGYGGTAIMLGESALSLAFDDLPTRAGQITPAVAMGDALRRRLEAAGIKFEVLDGVG
ncbi:MAG TPA: saccharopine dehydrogenase NADP-binding domain-containing protein [Solirubrobacteraceae bacterium]|nr:saccharopine dehydrogenase NADP-binding domain-containing protein [Solirubrobacteraceae bacterium]